MERMADKQEKDAANKKIADAGEKAAEKAEKAASGGAAGAGADAAVKKVEDAAK